MNPKISASDSRSKISSQNLLLLLLLLQFAIAPFYYQPNLGGEGLYLPYNSSVWIVAIWIIAAAAILFNRSQHIILPKYWLGLACLPAGALLIGIFIETANRTEWLTRLGVITGGYLFFIALFQFKLTAKQIEQSLYIILLFGVIACAYAVIQIHGLSHLYPFIPTNFNHVPIGIFQQKNIQASFMATFLVLIYYLVSRPSLRQAHVLIKLSFCFCVFFAGYVIAASGSRVGLLGAIVGLFILFIGRWKLLLAVKKIFVILLLCTIAGGALQSSGIFKTAAKFDRAMGGVESDIRWKVYRMSWDLFTEAPVVGHGLGSFQKVFQDKRRDYQQQDILHLGNAPRFSHPHNEIIFWLIEGGVIAVIGILIAAFSTFVMLFKLGWQRGCGYAALLIPITLHTQVELPFYTSNTHWLLLLFLLFVVHQHNKKQLSITKLTNIFKRTIGAIFLTLAIMTTWDLVHTQQANSDLGKYYASGSKELKYLQKPLEAFYFRDQAQFLYLRQQMLEGVQKNDPKPVVELIYFTEGLIQKIPSFQYYITLASSYNLIGKKDMRDKYLKEAMDTYEDNPKLLQIKQNFEQQDQLQKQKKQNVQDS